VNHYLKEKKINDEIIDSIQQSIIKTSVAPSLNPQQGYMNNDLIPILNWFNGLLEKQSDVSPSDCMLAYAMFNAYKLSGLTCEERNLKNLQNVLSACAEDLTEKGLQKKKLLVYFIEGWRWAILMKFATLGKDRNFFKNIHIVKSIQWTNL
jgi:hypothetical protein